jgi:hypothetical protein
VSYVKYLLSSDEVQGVFSYSSGVNTGTELNPASLSRSEDFHDNATADNEFLNSSIFSSIAASVSISLNIHVHASRYVFQLDQQSHLI